MLFLNEDEVRSLIDLAELRSVVGDALNALSRGEATMAPRIVVRSSNGLTVNMTAHVSSFGIVATKTVTIFPENSGTGLPTHQAAILVTDASNGQPLALMDGTFITATRTAAASALATDLLARTDSSILTILGTGVQARSHAEAIPLARKIKNIRVWGRDFAKAEALAGELNDKGFSTEAIADLQEAQTGAHIVSATTHSPDPVVISDALSPGTHVNSVGVNLDGREVDAATVARAAVIAVESRQAALAPPEEAGANDLTWAIRDGVIQRDTAFVELGELLEGAPSRTDDSQITLYKGVGAAVEDAAAAWLVLQRAREAGIGRSIQ